MAVALPRSAGIPGLQGGLCWAGWSPQWDLASALGPVCEGRVPLNPEATSGPKRWACGRWYSPVPPRACMCVCEACALGSRWHTSLCQSTCVLVWGVVPGVVSGFRCLVSMC